MIKTEKHCKHIHDITEDLEVMLSPRFSITVRMNSHIRAEFEAYLKRIYACPEHGDSFMDFRREESIEHIDGRKLCYCTRPT